MPWCESQLYNLPTKVWQFWSAFTITVEWCVISFLTPGCNNRYKWCTEAMLVRYPGARWALTGHWMDFVGIIKDGTFYFGLNAYNQANIMYIWVHLCIIYLFYSFNKWKKFDQDQYKFRSSPISEYMEVWNCHIHALNILSFAWNYYHIHVPLCTAVLQRYTGSGP
jgi:hypothetical protein